MAHNWIPIEGSTRQFRCEGHCKATCTRDERGRLVNLIADPKLAKHFGDNFSDDNPNILNDRRERFRKPSDKRPRPQVHY